MDLIRHLRSFRLLATRTIEQSGKGRLSLLWEIFLASYRNPTLGTFDYFVFRLHQFSGQKQSPVRDYLGWRAQEELSQILNPRSAVMPAWDKFTFHLYAHSLGIPVPAVAAVFRPNSAPTWQGPGTLLQTAEQLATWLRANDTWPLFAKPCYSQQSKGCHYLAAYSATDDTIVSDDGSRMTVESFTNDIVLAPNGPFFRRDMGYLFQRVLRPLEQIAALTGNNATSALRIVIAQDEGKQEIVAAVWKMIRGGNISDTRIDDPLGHLHVPIDPTTGIAGAARKAYEEAAYPLHPDTGMPIEGFQVPCWEEAVATCLQAASIFPMMRIQHWDLAITDEGPCLLEVNDIGAIEFLQIFGRGLLTPFLKELLRRHGNPRRHPWIRRLCA